ncbi:molybdopterin-dependent oxidoreductase [Methylocapsa palsarum]|uniref:DMSO/TMAO reductase YedYZ, molybdopterin-dependent catalytic subunit n=1 Tax=Methylocapsa palsarum TaxID=1612308 RepID=A0A1I3YPX9_9HYPH|nr:molybdopterin-dependent oxidoreductase [Methylocapsa palsarum]SFK33845.1 DMSO/TMAO reductase YedYZ, molybdopterin-dependent catalytic subunit [Methylocapsa palsarum]
MWTRRRMMKSSGGILLAFGGDLLGGDVLGGDLLEDRGGSPAAAAGTAHLPFANGERQIETYPGKRPMIVLTSRPPQLETPFSVFDEGVLTPNDAFFVRYHLADIPLQIDPEAFRIEVKGNVERPFSLSVDDLRNNYDPVEIVAVNQCSGNSRGFFEPRVAGGQLGNGAMGNARWRGVPLKAVLDKAGVRAGAVQVSFNGLDGPVIPDTPDFSKALDIDHARDGEVMIAYSMNGKDLPWLNGFPVRLVVPGFYGTYWVKHLNEIAVLDKPLDNFWMKTAYRIPANACACTEPGKTAAATVPINRLNVRSFITNIADGRHVKADTDFPLRGVAFDGGYGVTSVDISSDGGHSWVAATLGEDLGKYSFREWRTIWRLPKGDHVLMVRATNRIGQSQPMEPLWNPAGYMRNVVEKTRVISTSRSS